MNLLTTGEGILDEDLSKNFVSQVIVLRWKAWRHLPGSMRDIGIVAEGLGNIFHPNGLRHQFGLS